MAWPGAVLPLPLLPFAAARAARLRVSRITSQCSVLSVSGKQWHAHSVHTPRRFKAARPPGPPGAHRGAAMVRARPRLSSDEEEDDKLALALKARQGGKAKQPSETAGGFSSASRSSAGLAVALQIVPHQAVRGSKASEVLCAVCRRAPSEDRPAVAQPGLAQLTSYCVICHVILFVSSLNCNVTLSHNCCSDAVTAVTAVTALQCSVLFTVAAACSMFPHSL